MPGTGWNNAEASAFYFSSYGMARTVSRAPCLFRDVFPYRTMPNSTLARVPSSTEE